MRGVGGAYHRAYEDEHAVALEGVEDVPLVAPPDRRLELGERRDEDVAFAASALLVLLLAVDPVQLADREVVEKPEAEQDAEQVAAEQVEEELRGDARGRLRGPTNTP